MPWQRHAAARRRAASLGTRSISPASARARTGAGRPRSRVLRRAVSGASVMARTGYLYDPERRTARPFCPRIWRIFASARRRGGRCGPCRHARCNRGQARRRRRRDRLEAAPDALPLRLGRGRHQRRARQRLRGQPRDPHVRHRQGLGLPGRPGRDRDHVHRGARRHLRARAHGRGLLALRRRPHRAAPVRRRRLAAHRLLGRHHRPRADPRALRAALKYEVPVYEEFFAHRPRDRRRPLRRRAGLGHRPRRRARASRRTTRSSPPAASGACTTARRTPTPAPATACRWPGAPACRSRTWSSCSSTRRR